MFDLRILSMTIAILAAGCSKQAAPPPAAERKTPEEGHGHKPSAHGGILVSLGNDQYHAEVVPLRGGEVHLYLLGADESKVVEIEVQPLPALAKAGGAPEAVPFEFKPLPQPGDSAGKASRFSGTLPPEVAGKPAIITVPAVRINGERFRIAFNLGETHTGPAMPAKLATDEERKLFMTAGGKYTEADIKANGDAIPTVKYKGIRAEHDDDPKPGEAICPISKTKANPKFPWVIGGKTYTFCCVPCIEEFVALAKEKPDDVKDPKEYVKR